MKNKYKPILTIGFFITFTLLGSQSLAQEPPKEITISGTVEAITFDASGNVKQIALCVKIQINENDYDFINYIIVNDRKSKELFRLIGKEVQLKGKMITKEGNKYITVKEYKVI